VAAGLHGANRLGGNSLSDLLVFGKLAGEYAADYAKKNTAGTIDQSQVDEAARRALEPFERGSKGENPYTIQHELQDLMQDNVGIVRTQSEMERALEGIARLKARARNAGVPGNREYNPGWHTAIDLDNLLTVSEAITRAAIERPESRGAQFREDCPTKRDDCGTFNIVLRRAPDGSMRVVRQPVKPMPDDLKMIIEENK
jgi:succinate dehydrogenase / fumarate reductase flavoprotein subunit